MKNLFLFLLFLSAAFPTSAQEHDSTAFATQAWTTQTIKKGIVWKQAHFHNLFGGEQEINLIEIDLKRHLKKLRLAGISKGTKLTSTFAQENNAVVAINGGFFNTKIGGATDFIKIEGEVINVTTNKHPRSNAYLTFDKQSIQIIPQTADSIRETKVDNVLRSGPLLISGGEIMKISKGGFSMNKHPRTVVALRGQNLIFMTIDGRNKQSHGVTLFELSRLLKWYACDAAMNLDGGGSTTMYIKDQPDNGVVNYPSDNKKFDHHGERSVANIIYIKN